MSGPSRPLTTTTKPTRAFSLVELSIVLVILGLLIGGILSGQALIRAAELRSVGTEYSRWVTATQTFRDKYFALPGDFRDATRFWGRLNSNSDCATNSSASVNGTSGACDGSGSGQIDWQNGLGAGASTESHQFWRQLALAGLIEGSYTGLGGSGGSAEVTIGTNAPRSKLNTAGWGIMGNGICGLPAAQCFQSNDYRNFLVLGTAMPNNIPVENVLKPEEAWNIDAKLDDGKPATGRILARFNGTNNCTNATSNTDYASTYYLVQPAIMCSFYFTNIL
jgi:prepilin-type N-terminal cleavage/methylation domain-containing protein